MKTLKGYLSKYFYILASIKLAMVVFFWTASSSPVSSVAQDMKQQALTARCVHVYKDEADCFKNIVADMKKEDVGCNVTPAALLKAKTVKGAAEFCKKPKFDEMTCEMPSTNCQNANHPKDESDERIVWDCPHGYFSVGTKEDAIEKFFDRGVHYQKGICRSIVSARTTQTVQGYEDDSKPNSVKAK